MAGPGSISFILLNFRSRRWWLTVDAEIPRSAAIRLPVHRWSRRAAIRPRRCSGILLCSLWGREDRFSRPSTPSARKRVIHLWAVILETPKAAAASLTVVPSWSTRRTSSSQLYGISLAFLWVFIRPSWGLVFLEVSAFQIRAEWTATWLQFTSSPRLSGRDSGQPAPPPTRKMVTDPGPCAPSSSFCSISAERDGPVIRLTLRGSSRSWRIRAQTSS